MFTLIPLMIVPFIAYNVLMLGGDASPFQAEVFAIDMMSGGRWSMDVGDILLLVSLFFLFIEIMKSTRTSNASVMDHLLSTILFVVFLVEFLLVPGAATPTFFLIMAMTAIDVMAGFSVSIRSAGRDVSFN